MENIQVIHRNLDRFNLLKNKILSNWDSSEFILEYVNENFKSYIQILKSFEGYIAKRLYENKEITACLYEKIIKTFYDYLRGNNSLAYEDMKESFLSIEEILKRKISKRFTMGSEFGFKARVINNNEPIPTRKDIFHIPFEKRHLVRDNRYSRHGIPSIYLGSSIYDCYVELGSPPLQNFWVSLFIFSQDKHNMLSDKYINIIDLTLSHLHKIDMHLIYVNKDEEKYIDAIDRLVDDILLWPLIFSCSIPCKYPESPFQQEYIIPQLLYQICSEHNQFVGIKYLSTKIKCVNQNIYQRAMYNYALPSNNVKKSGYCPKLASQLVLSEPITVDKLKKVRIDTTERDISPGFLILSNMHNSLKEDENIILLDKMTIYFQRLVDCFRENHNIDLLTPIYGWKEN